MSSLNLVDTFVNSLKYHCLIQTLKNIQQFNLFGTWYHSAQREALSKLCNVTFDNLGKHPYSSFLDPIGLLLLILSQYAVLSCFLFKKAFSVEGVSAFLRSRVEGGLPESDKCTSMSSCDNLDD